MFLPYFSSTAPWNTIAIKWTLGDGGNQEIYKIDNLCTFIITYENANNGKRTSEKCPNKRVKAERMHLEKKTINYKKKKMK